MRIKSTLAAHFRSERGHLLNCFNTKIDIDDMSAPTVFLSAATLDLEDFRKDISAALERAGCKVLDQQTDNAGFSASAGDVLFLLRQHLDKSDFVLHLAGQAYGGEPDGPAFPEYPEFRCSYTQFEYYYAHSKGKKVFAFLCGDKFPLREFLETGKDSVERQIRRNLQALHRERVKTGTFQNTPWESSGFRTWNELLESTSSMLKATAAVIGTIRDLENDPKAKQTPSNAIGEKERKIANELTKRFNFFAVAISLLAILGLFAYVQFSSSASKPKDRSQSVFFGSLSVPDQERMRGATVADVVDLALECENKRFVDLANLLEKHPEVLLVAVEVMVKNNIGPDSLAEKLTESEKTHLMSTKASDIVNFAIQSSHLELKKLGDAFSDNPDMLLGILKELIK